MSETLLRIEAAARIRNSVSRALSHHVVDTLDIASIITRDLTADPLPKVGPDWFVANATPAHMRKPAQADLLRPSDKLIEELRRADTLLISTPVNEFGLAPPLQTWVDKITRLGETFHHTARGTEGLLADKRTILALASNSSLQPRKVDYVSGYLKRVLAMVGIRSVEVLMADRAMMGEDGRLTGTLRHVVAHAA